MGGWAAAGAAAGSVIGSVVGRIGTGPKRQEKYGRRMFDYQAAYNHPIQQMKRLKEAGLNPHSIYGEGTKGATGQNTGMGDVDVTQGPQQGLGEGLKQGIQTYMSTKQAQLKADEQAIQNSLLNLEEKYTSKTQPSRMQKDISSNELKTQENAFNRKVRDQVVKDPKALGHFAEAEVLSKRLIKQRYLNSQIDTYIKDQTKADQIKLVANNALMAGAGSTLREQEAILKQAEVNLYKKLPKSAVTNIIMVLKMLLNR